MAAKHAAKGSRLGGSVYHNLRSVADAATRQAESAHSQIARAERALAQQYSELERAQTAYIVNEQAQLERAAYEEHHANHTYSSASASAASFAIARAPLVPSVISRWASSPRQRTPSSDSDSDSGSGSGSGSDSDSSSPSRGGLSASAAAALSSGYTRAEVAVSPHEAKYREAIAAVNNAQRERFSSSGSTAGALGQLERARQDAHLAKTHGLLHAPAHSTHETLALTNSAASQKPARGFEPFPSFVPLNSTPPPRARLPAWPWVQIARRAHGGVTPCSSALSLVSRAVGLRCGPRHAALRHATVRARRRREWRAGGPSASKPRLTPDSSHFPGTCSIVPASVCGALERGC